jgi:hypothetical protein
MSALSSRAQLEQIAKIVAGYMRLPLSEDSVPGSIMESTLAHVRSAKILGKYDFVDVVDGSTLVGWQVKSTKASTPVTWKRAKIPNREDLIHKSKTGKPGLKALGDAIINFCNAHIEHSFETYSLSEIAYSRLILRDERKATYFERVLATKRNPRIFRAADFLWHWSTPKASGAKEQLPALHGIHVGTGKKWFAWHGLGENQLHFCGEPYWWPAIDSPNRIDFLLPSPSQRLNLNALMRLLDQFPN